MTTIVYKNMTMTQEDVRTYLGQIEIAALCNEPLRLPFSRRVLKTDGTVVSQFVRLAEKTYGRKWVDDVCQAALDAEVD